MSTRRTATRWAWDTLAARRSRVEVPHKLTLLAAADLLDRAVEGAGRDMFHHGVLDVTVIGFDAHDLAAAIGVTGRTALGYCRALAAQGLLDTRDDRHFTLPPRAWATATGPADAP